jgi:hypothetical protein
MKIVRAILIGLVFPFLTQRKLRFLESQWNWKVVRRGVGAIDYARKNSVLGISYNRIGDDLLYATLFHVRSAEESDGVPVEGSGFGLKIILGALTDSYPPPRIVWVAGNLRQLGDQLELLRQALENGAKPILMGEEMFDRLEAYQKRVDRDYYRDYILSAVEPELAKDWMAKSNDEIYELYREWCDYRFGRKKRVET